MSNEVCGDNRFEIIKKAKQDLLESTNIQTSEDEMQVIDNILFRCWQMGWLEKYNQPKTDWIPCEERLPHTEMPVWTTHENGQVIEHYWYRGEFVNNYPLEPRPYPKVIAWMPKEIPQPYKKEGAENE